MASFTTAATIEEPGLPGDNHGILPPRRGAGGDDGPASASPDYATRLRRARLGLLVALTPIFMLFVSFTSAYVVRQGLPTFDPRTNTMVRDWIPVKLPAILLVNTCVLLLSSLGMELARRTKGRAAAVEGEASGDGGTVDEKKDVWMAGTLALGVLFLVGQWMAWRQLAASGFYVTTTPSSSFIYLLTGTHAIHLLGGVIALFAAGMASLLGRSAVTRRIVVDITAWYWHFMAALWVYILCLLEFAG
jgi:cytochrome c oxidase subunit III